MVCRCRSRGLVRCRTDTGTASAATPRTPRCPIVQRTHRFEGIRPRPAPAGVRCRGRHGLHRGRGGRPRTLSSIAAQERATYVGSRHVGQVEALLYAERPQDVEEALSAVLPKGTSIVRGTTVTDQRALAKANAPAVAEGWSVAPRPGSGSEGRLQPIEIVNDAQTFETLTGRQWTDGERAALQSGRVLAPSPDYLAGDRVTLAVPSGGEKHDTSRKAAGVLVEEPVDDTTRSRAVAYVSASAVRAWGGLPVDYSVIATTGDQAPLAELDGKLAKALEPVTIPCPRCGSNAAPKGRRPPSGTPCSVSPSPRWQPHSASSSPLQRLNCGPISCVCTVSASPPCHPTGRRLAVAGHRSPCRVPARTGRPSDGWRPTSGGCTTMWLASSA